MPIPAIGITCTLYRADPDATSMTPEEYNALAPNPFLNDEA